MSDDSLGFDPVDDELRRRLGAAGPRPGDPDVTLGALRPRHRRAKRRHQLVVAAGSACVVAVLIGVGAAVLSAGGSDPQNVRIPPANSSTPTSPVPSTVGSTPQPTVAPGRSGADTAAPGATGPAAATSAAPVAPTTHTYASSGGTVTVKVDNGAALSIVSTQAASGYSEERHDTGPDRVEVRFTSNTTEWRIRVDLVNGQPVEQITQH